MVMPIRSCKLSCPECGYSKTCVKSAMIFNVPILKITSLPCLGCNTKCPKCGAKMHREPNGNIKGVV